MSESAMIGLLAAIVVLVIVAARIRRGTWGGLASTPLRNDTDDALTVNARSRIKRFCAFLIPGLIVSAVLVDGNTTGNRWLAWELAFTLALVCNGVWEYYERRSPRGPQPRVDVELARIRDALLVMQHEAETKIESAGSIAYWSDTYVKAWTRFRDNPTNENLNAFFDVSPETKELLESRV